MGAADLKITTGRDVVRTARAFVGGPWRHQGRDAFGLDCAGLLLAVAHRLHLAHPQALHYPPLPPLCLFDMLLVEYCWPISEPELGCVLRLLVAGRAQHLAIAGDYPDGGLTLIHALMNVGRVTEHRLDAKWQRRIVSAWCIRGVH